MHVKTNRISSTQVVLTITATEAYLSDLKLDSLKKLAKNMKLPGFRAGHAPLNLVEKNVDDATLQSEFLDSAINKLYSSALSSEHLHPVGNPDVSVKKFVPFSLLEFEAAVDVLGEIKLADYKKIKIKKEPVIVTPDDVKVVLNDLALKTAEKHVVDRPAKKLDLVTIDFDGTNEKGEPVSGAAAKDYPISIGSNSFISGFEDNLIGLKTGDTKTFTLKFPNDYPVNALAKKNVTFSVKINKVEESMVPKITDDFAKTVGPFETLADLKKDISKQLSLEKNRQAEVNQEVLLIKKIVEMSKVELPAALIKQQIDRDLISHKQNLAYQGQTYGEFLKSSNLTEEAFVETVLRPQALEKVKTGLVLSEISDQENIQVTQEEFDTYIEDLKKQYSDPSMQEQLSNPENRRSLASRLLTDKTIAKIKEYAFKD